MKSIYNLLLEQDYEIILFEINCYSCDKFNYKIKLTNYDMMDFSNRVKKLLNIDLKKAIVNNILKITFDDNDKIDTINNFPNQIYELNINIHEYYASINNKILVKNILNKLPSKLYGLNIFSYSRIIFNFNNLPPSLKIFKLGYIAVRHCTIQDLIYLPLGLEHLVLQNIFVNLDNLPENLKILDICDNVYNYELDDFNNLPIGLEQIIYNYTKYKTVSELSRNLMPRKYNCRDKLI